MDKLPLPDLSIETLLAQKGYQHIVGIDEVGRGSWAGPLVAAGVILPQDFQIPENLADSKLLRHQQRVKLAKIIKSQSIGYTIVSIENRRIDKIGIANATHEAFRKIIRSLDPTPIFVS